MSPPTIKIVLYYGGAPVEMTFSDATTEDIERTVQLMLKRKGWTAPVAIERVAAALAGSPQSGSGRSAQNRPIDPNAPQCPHHNRAMRESNTRPGTFFCSAKAEGELANNKGYCNYQWYAEAGT